VLWCWGLEAQKVVDASDALFLQRPLNAYDQVL